MLALKLLGVWRWLMEAVSALLSLAGRYPLQAALIASLALSGWLWWGKQEALAERDAARSETAAIRTASEQAKALARKQQDETRAKYAQLAKDAADEHDQALDAARDLADAHIDRLRAKSGVCRSAAAPSSTGENPSKPAELPAATDMVGITPQDLRACSAWVAFGITHQQAAVAKVEAGLAEIAP